MSTSCLCTINSLWQTFSGVRTHFSDPARGHWSGPSTSSVGRWELWPWDNQVFGLPHVHLLELWGLFFLLVHCPLPDPAPQTAYIGLMPTTAAASGLKGP